MLSDVRKTRNFDAFILVMVVSNFLGTIPVLSDRRKVDAIMATFVKIVSKMH